MQTQRSESSTLRVGMFYLGDGFDRALVNVQSWPLKQQTSPKWNEIRVLKMIHNSDIELQASYTDPGTDTKMNHTNHKYDRRSQSKFIS